jgi:hypothetical protein
MTATSNSILIYLRANLTAQGPITKLARGRRKKQRNKIKNKEFYIKIRVILKQEQTGRTGILAIAHFLRVKNTKRMT